MVPLLPVQTLCHPPAPCAGVCAEGRALLSPCPRDRSQGWTQEAWPQLGNSQALLCVCRIREQPPLQNDLKASSLTQKEREKVCVIKPRFNPSNQLLIWEKPMEEFEMSKVTERSYKYL